MIPSRTTIAAFTYNKAQEITAWHHHTTDGLFEDVAVIPVSDHDQVWFIVKRTIGGATKRYIEYLADDFEDQEDCWFVDCGLKYDGAGATTFTGLDHLKGKTVSILADGAVMPDATIASGTFTLDSAASVVIAGLPYTSILEPMDLETGKKAAHHRESARRYIT